MSMKHSKPYFQLARVQNDGTREEEEIAFYQLVAQMNAGQDLKLTRRGLLTLSALGGAALLTACFSPSTVKGHVPMPVALRQGPSADFPALKTIPGGSDIMLIARNNATTYAEKWVLIQTGDGATGWVNLPSIITDSSAAVDGLAISQQFPTSTLSPTATSSATDTRVPSPTRTDTATPTRTASPTRTPPETSTPTETPSRTPTRTVTRTQTHTRAPTNKPRPTNTTAPPPAVEQLQGTVLKTGFSDVELKTGPGTMYARVTTAGNGEPLTLIARTADSKWILCIARDGGQGWVPIENIEVEGNIPVSALRVETNIPPTPLPVRPTSAPGPRPPFPGGGSYCTCNKVCVCIPVYY